MMEGDFALYLFMKEVLVHERGTRSCRWGLQKRWVNYSEKSNKKNRNLEKKERIWNNGVLKYIQSTENTHDNGYSLS